MQLRQNFKHFLILLLSWGKGYKGKKRDIRVLIPEGNLAEAHGGDIPRYILVSRHGHADLTQLKLEAGKHN